ncbi:MAG: dephospho-CoA kinase [Povalibacter sp.]
MSDTAHADHPPLLIALTGGIASGKSAVAHHFAQLGVPVIDADQVAREVVEPGTEVLKQIIAAFGNEVLDESGTLDRRCLRDRVFADPDQRRILESITHPAIRAEMARQAQAADGLYQIHVIPLLVETGRMRDYDRVLVVDCPEEHQIARLLERDGTSREQAEQILAAQASREARLQVADDVIVNTGTLQDLEQFVLTLHRNYELLAAANAYDPE